MRRASANRIPLIESAERLSAELFALVTNLEGLTGNLEELTGKLMALCGSLAARSQKFGTLI
jgi:hypothetical protein